MSIFDKLASYVVHARPNPPETQWLLDRIDELHAIIEAQSQQLNVLTILHMRMEEVLRGDDFPVSAEQE